MPREVSWRGEQSSLIPKLKSKGIKAERIKTSSLWKKQGTLYSIAYLILLLTSGVFGSLQAQLPISLKTLGSFREREGTTYSNQPISPDQFLKQYEKTIADFMAKKGKEEYLVVQSTVFQKPSDVSSIVEHSLPQRPLAVVNEEDLPGALRRYRNVSHVVVPDFFLTGAAIHRLFFMTQLAFQDARPQSQWKAHFVAPFHTVPPYRFSKRDAPHAEVAVHRDVIDLSRDLSIEKYFATQIREMREAYRWHIERLKSSSPFFYSWIEENADGKRPDGTYSLDPSRLRAITKGVYLWTGKRGEPIGVIKLMRGAAPICFEKRHEGISAEEKRSCLSMVREVVASEFAKQMGVWQVVPETVLVILESSAFSLLSDGSDSIKLCSVQKFVPDCQSLDYSSEIPLDRWDCEEISILDWVTGEGDANWGNFLVQPNGRVKKGDNDQTFPFENRIQHNAFVFHRNAELPLSPKGRALIEALPVKALADLLREYGLEEAIFAMKERIRFLQEVAQIGISLKEINARFDCQFR